MREIARGLRRSVSTISRELKCNERPRHPYSPSQAQKRYENRRKARGRKHILCDAEMREYIRRFIQEAHWSPEQISNRLKLESAEVQISSTAIYRAIKSEPGHYEADTVVGKRGGECLLSLVDRKYRFTLAVKLPKGTAEAARDAMTAPLGGLPEDKVKSATPDRGTEFTLYQEISKAQRGLPFYFADPHSSRQRGTNENTNASAGVPRSKSSSICRCI